MLPTDIKDTIMKYWDAFNAYDLDTVMTCFSDGALYQPGDGKTHRGKAEIRAAFEPQFNGAFGAVRFDEMIGLSTSRIARLCSVMYADITFRMPSREGWLGASRNSSYAG